MRKYGFRLSQEARLDIIKTMAVHKKYNALGRGLDALISTSDIHPHGSSTINEIALDLIDANPNQPRREFDQEALQQLADSIRQIGIIQPITLRQTDDNRFQLIAGERRWRAASMAGLKTIPAYIRTIKDENIMEMALVENIQREDLNAIEIALAYEHLMSASGMTQEKVAERVGKSRAAVANYLRLLKLPAQVQMALQNKDIDMGHARALLALDSPSLQIKIFREIQKKAYSVRKVEEIVKRINNGEDPEQTGSPSAANTPHSQPATAADDTSGAKTDETAQRLATALDATVTITRAASGKGKISIAFNDDADLQRLASLIDKPNAADAN